MAKAGTSVEQYDLTMTNAKYMDRHLLLPLIDFLQNKGMHTKEELGKAKLSLLSKTNMVDYTVEVYKEVNGSSAPQEMSARRGEGMKSMEPLLDIVSDAGRVAELKAERCFNQAYLAQQHSITPQHIELLHKYAKFLFECGDYATAGALLGHYRQLTLDAEKGLSALWGKLASEILTQDYDGALDDVNALKELIDSSKAGAAMVLQQRCWLMHWALFLLGNHHNGRAVICDLFLTDKYFEAIHTHANFEQAQARLADCATVLDADFFLSNSEELFLKSARLVLFEAYCRIHERIDLTSLAEKLGMEQIAAEKWIVNMVSDAKLNAKIDSESGHVILGVQPPDVYQQVIEKTKGLSFRSYVLAQNIEKTARAEAAAKAK